MSSKLQLKKDEPADESLTCPSCGAPMPVAAVICIQCGYNTRTKARVGDDVERKRPTLLIVAGAALIIGAIAFVALRSLNSSSETMPPPVATTPAATTSAPAPNVTSTETTGAESNAAAEATADAPPASAPESASETNGSDAAATGVQPETEQPAEPAEPAIDWAAIETEQMERATAELDRRAPMFELGEAIELRLTNGIIHRGIFQNLRAGTLFLAVTTNDVVELPVESLDRGSRTRVEPEYRERYIEFFVRKRIAEMQHSQTNAP